jgi:hypothetical protein
MHKQHVRAHVRASSSKERLLAQRALALVCRLEPLVEARVVEAVAAGGAPHAGQLVRAHVQHAVAYGARLRARELLVQVAPPCVEGLGHGGALRGHARSHNCTHANKYSFARTHARNAAAAATTTTTTAAARGAAPEPKAVL